jgi:hypothetical protein
MSAELQLLIGKVLSDEKLAKALAENPEQTLRDNGVEPTPEMVAALKAVDAAQVQKLAAAFGNKEGAAV